MLRKGSIDRLIISRIGFSYGVRFISNMTKATIPVFSALFLLVIILILPDASIGAPRAQTVRFMCSNQREHNTTLFVTNFVATMENISEQMRTNGFGVSVVGTGPDANYGLAQCYGDLSLLDCVLCYAEAHTIFPRCFPYNGGRIFLDGCFMRAENYSFFQEFTGSMDTFVCGNKTTKDSAFQETARRAVQQAATAAPANNGYARADLRSSGTGNDSAHVLADCWRTLNATSCRTCLENASRSILECLPWSEGRALNNGCFMRYSDTNFLNPIPGSGSSRGRLLNAGCYMRYSTQKFYNNSASPAPAENGGGSRRLAIILDATSSSVALLLILAFVSFFSRKRVIKRRREKKRLGSLLQTVNKSKLNFSYETLEKATNYFSNVNKLGQGGSGSVYKGILPNGQTVAIKRLFFHTTQWVDHFFNEVNLISGIHHKNLVQLLGCSITGPESLLVYEYVPNRSLHEHVFVKKNAEAQPLRWEDRYKIILGTAEGLAFLHEESKLRIIHRDIKLSNVLINDEFTAKIADFGLARLFPEDQSHISTVIAGTLGYMAPEYVVRGKLTEKVDVYSFGVLLIEVVCGRKNTSPSEYSFSILQKIWNLYGAKKLCEGVDPSLRGNFIEDEASRLLHIGLLCVQASAELRPSMSVVVKMLKSEHEIPEPTQPPFLNSSSREISPLNRDYSPYFQSGSYTQSSGNEITESFLEPR